MTSVGFNIGYNMKEDKPSSKVLKPPGGGTSDIFGRQDDQGASQGGKRHGGPTPKNTHDRIFGYVGKDDESEKAVKPEAANGKAIDHEETKEIEKPTEVSQPTPKPEAKKVEEEKKVEEPPKTSIRIRQPPGGKSSGIF